MATRDRVLGISPLGVPAPRLVAAVCRAGALGVLDLGTGDRRCREALRLARAWSPSVFGVRVAAGCELRPDDLPGPKDDGAGIDTVVLAWDSPWRVSEIVGRYRVLVEVTSIEEALHAVRVGAHGLVARGNEAGGRVGQQSSFILLQHLLAQEELDLPVWVCGGMGMHTAPAAVIGGAAGVVLDTQLGLLAESALGAQTAALRTLDGSETTMIDGDRVLARRGQGALPLGQDGFLAARFAERFGTVESAVRAVLSAIADAPGTAAMLRPESPLSRAWGTALPVAQGPMTRVSDQAGFAASVAGQGAMPFLALALAGRDETRAMLTDTRAAVGDRPWGVGVLGFAPEDVRSAQLEVIRELRPSCAVIAGGRPSQAAALEAAGISTFLHVPAPVLLRQFLDAGARKFVFEGSECGGHIGPRCGFALWEAQLSVLREREDLDGVQVLFAGGVHDERSAAMLAAMSAPLAERGAAVGMLMGTAYLFTDEAVRAGAIGPSFQRQMVLAEGTDLLETTPGHVTRCVRSPFTEHFGSVGARLRKEGLADREVWEELERLNVGRLRLASKGLRRQGAELVEVDERTRLAEGLFMAGEVAALRSTTTTVAELHESVSTGAARFLAERGARVRAESGGAGPVAEAPEPLDIVVVGMAGMFPGADDLTSFWTNVVRGVDAVDEVPSRRWDPELYYRAPDAGEQVGRYTSSKWGGFLPSIPFDPLRYGIPPSSLGSIEPVQLLALEAARCALADAGYAEDSGFDRSRVSVVFGAEAGSDLSNAAVLRTVLPSYLGEIPPELAEQLPELTEDSFPGVLANVIAGRIANRLDLGGANYTVDAACASSLTAIDVACKELVAGTSDLVLCGGADLHNGINDYLLFSSVRALSPTGRCRTFDASADGIALGEGVACVALKRLADAERDGDRVYAVIKGVGSASDGKSLGLTAPRPDGQRAALERAYRNARISPADVGLVEAHGTGTVVGDRTELGVLSALFIESGAGRGTCALGSVKSQIGHTKCAAGLAGLIKAAMALHTGVTPPTLHVEEPNPAWDAKNSPFVFLPRARPWSAPPERRVAGVSAFGFGGTNFHVVLQGYEGSQVPQHSLQQWPAELFTFRGGDTAVRRNLQELLELIATNEANGRPWRLRDLAAWTTRRDEARSGKVRTAIVASTVDDLEGLLRRALAGEHDPAAGLHVASDVDGGDIGEVAFLFPGQGSQRPGMLAELFVAFPEIQNLLRLSSTEHGWDDVLFPAAAFDQDTERVQWNRLRDTRTAQPALGITGLAVHELLGRLGVEPDMVGGHSYGELVALSVAGAFDAATLIELSEARAAAILSAAGTDPGAMAAVAAPAGDVEPVLHAAGLADQVVIANHNAPAQVVISGPTAPVDQAVDRLRAEGCIAKRVPVACAFHSPVTAGAGAGFGAVLANSAIRAPELPVWSNRTTERYSPGPDAVRAELAAQIGEPVRFAQQIEAMYAAGARVFVEAGPGRVLTGLVGEILGDRPHRAVTCDAPAGQGLRGFLGAVAALAVAGADVRTGWLFAGREHNVVDPRAVPKRPGWTVDGQTVRTASGDHVPGGLRPARRIEEYAMTPRAVNPQSGGHEELISEFLRTSREMVAAQRDVMLGFLGTAPSSVPLPAPAFTGPELTSAPEPAFHFPGAPSVEPTEPAAEVAEVAEAPDSPVDMMTSVLSIVAGRTGYPIELIEPDLDLEADLSIDSIKRTEIAGELLSRFVGGVDLGDSGMDDLAKVRTARGVADWMSSRVNAPEAGPISSEDPVPSEGVASDVWPSSKEPDVPTGEEPRRYVMEPFPAGEGMVEPGILRGRSFLVFGPESPVADQLMAKLTGYGAEVTLAGATRELTEQDGAADGVIHLDALTGSDLPVLPESVAGFRSALGKDLQWWLVAVPGEPSSHTAGMRGLVRSVAREYPNTRATLVEVSAVGITEDIASALVAELLAREPAPVVSVRGGNRYTLSMVEAPLGALARTGEGRASPGSSEAAALGLDRDAVVLLIGGARGITARFAALLASVSGCRIELVGRTELSRAPEPPGVSDALDLPSLRTALARSGAVTPAEIDRQAGRILAQREVNATLDEVCASGSSARYHAVDVRDRATLHQVIKEVHAEHGRLDGVIHAAGVLEDRLLADKDAESFRRVFSTKVDGGRAMLAAVEQLASAPRFVALFGSIAAVLGNRGQADYAAANDALDEVAAEWSARTGIRSLGVHWGPWAPSARHGGMVSAELARSYAGRGVRLIDPDAGTLSLLQELAWGEAGSVIYTASGW